MFFSPLTLVLLPSQRLACKTKQGHALHSHGCVTSERKKRDISESGKDREGNKTLRPRGLVRARAGCEPSSFLIRCLKDDIFSRAARAAWEQVFFISGRMLRRNNLQQRMRELVREVRGRAEGCDGWVREMRSDQKALECCKFPLKLLQWRRISPSCRRIRVCLCDRGWGSDWTAVFLAALMSQLTLAPETRTQTTFDSRAWQCHTSHTLYVLPFPKLCFDFRAKCVFAFSHIPLMHAALPPHLDILRFLIQVGYRAQPY